MTGRVQRTVGRGYRPPPGETFVGPPTRYANPFSGDVYGQRLALNLYRLYAADKARRDPEWLAPLRRAEHLSCWCPVDRPCHADILLELLEHGTAASSPSST